MAVTRSDIAEGLGRLGLSRGDTVLFHTRLSAFGWVEGGAGALIDAILDVIGPEGTALAPTLTYSREHSADAPPVFGARTTPAVTGRTPEVFRARPEAVRSFHPTHSLAALGAGAESITAGHEDCSTPCGVGSPYEKLVEMGGKVALFGVGLENCTLIHYCEEVAEVPYHLQPRPALATITDAGGRTFRREIRLHQWGHTTDFARPEPVLLERGIMRKGRIGEAEVRLIEARPFARFLIETLRREPRYLLAEI